MTDDANPGPHVELRRWTRATYRGALRLKVRPEQEALVADNAHSLAQAYFHAEAEPYGVFLGDEPVGFLMLSTEDAARGVLWIWRFLIGAEHQGRGLGAAAVQAAIALARGRDGIHTLKLSHVDGVEGHPGPFYERCGFAYTGEVEDGERVMALAL